MTIPDEDADSAKPYDRLTVALIKESSVALDNIQSRHEGLKKADVINRSLRVYDFFDTQLDEGSKIYVEDRNGNLQRVHIL